jgi:ABC-2 type transport system permease protein
MRRFIALFSARNKEYIRDRGSLAWGLLFPILIVLGFSFAFSDSRQDLFQVAVHSSQAGQKTTDEQRLRAEKYVQLIDVDDTGPALDKLRRHQVDMVVSFAETPRYWVNQSSPKGYILERVLFGGGGPEASGVQKETVDGREIRYVDWLMGGLLSMNIMFSSLFGVGYVIVRYRKAGVLRRLKATPVSAFEFLSAQVASRLVLILLTCAVVVLGCRLLVDFQMFGSYVDLFVVFGLGSLCFIALALVVAARVASEEFAGGVLNLLTWPMVIFSGVWFSLEGANPWLQRLAQLFPLSHMVSAARAVMTEGASLAQVSGHLGVLAGLTVLFMIVSSTAFRWE